MVGGFQDPRQVLLMFSESQRYRYGVVEWMNNKALKNTPHPASGSSLPASEYKNKNFTDVTIRTIIWMLHSTGGLQLAEISFESSTRCDLMPSNVVGGMGITCTKPFTPAKPHSSLFEIRILVRDLDKGPLKKALGLPTIESRYVHKQTGSEFHIGCSRPDDPCSGICTCSIIFREALFKGEKFLQLEATLYREGLRGDQLAVRMDMVAPETRGLDPPPPPPVFGPALQAVMSDQDKAKERRAQKRRKIMIAQQTCKHKIDVAKQKGDELKKQLVSQAKAENERFMTALRAELGDELEIGTAQPLTTSSAVVVLHASPHLGDESASPGKSLSRSLSPSLPLSLVLFVMGCTYERVRVVHFSDKNKLRS